MLWADYNLFLNKDYVIFEEDYVIFDEDYVFFGRRLRIFFGRLSFRGLKIKVVIKDFWVLGFRVARRRHKVARVLVSGFRVIRGTNSLSKFK